MPEIFGTAILIVLVLLLNGACVGVAFLLRYWKGIRLRFTILGLLALFWALLIADAYVEANYGRWVLSGLCEERAGVRINRTVQSVQQVFVTRDEPCPICIVSLLLHEDGRRKAYMVIEFEVTDRWERRQRELIGNSENGVYEVRLIPRENRSCDPTLDRILSRLGRSDTGDYCLQLRRLDGPTSRYQSHSFLNDLPRFTGTLRTVGHRAIDRSTGQTLAESVLISWFPNGPIAGLVNPNRRIWMFGGHRCEIEGPERDFHLQDVLVPA